MSKKEKRRKIAVRAITGLYLMSDTPSDYRDALKDVIARLKAELVSTIGIGGDRLDPL